MVAKPPRVPAQRKATLLAAGTVFNWIDRCECSPCRPRTTHAAGSVRAEILSPLVCIPDRFSLLRSLDPIRQLRRLEPKALPPA